MESDVIISVLMPVYKPNVEYLKIAIDSVLNQTFKAFELLLLYEPCEGDGVERCVADIGDSRIRIIYTPPKSGLPRSLNIGLQQAGGRYIARMDADDYSLPDRFQKQYEYLESHQEISVLGGWLKIMGTDRLIFNYNVTTEQRKVGLLFQNYGVGHPTAMFRRDFFEINNIRYNEQIRGSEDLYLWSDIVKTGGNIDSLQEVVLEYRVFESQASQRWAEEMIIWDEWAKINLWKAFGCTDEHTIKNACNVTCINIAIDTHEAYEGFEMIKHSMQSIVNQQVLDAELAFWWLYGALLRVKHCGDWSMLKHQYLLELVPKNKIKHVIKRLLDVKKAN